MLKSIRILLSIAAHMDYEIWQMDVKTAFLNGSIEENIHMKQPEGFIEKGKEHLVCKLNRSIYGLKQASRSWNIRFNEVIQSYGFIQSPDESCVYKKCNGNVVVFLVLYVDNIFGSWKQYQNVVRSKGMVVQAIRYEGLGRMHIFLRSK